MRVCFLPRERRVKGESLRARFCFDPLPHPLLINQSIPVPLSGDAAAVSKFAADVDALKKRVGMPDDADLEAAVAAQRLKTARGDVRRVINAASVDGVLCVPRDIAYDVLVRAEEIRANEKKIFGWVAEGQSVHQITKQGGYF